MVIKMTKFPILLFLIVGCFSIIFGQQFYESVTGTNIFAHERYLQTIANSHQGSRTQASGGFAATIEYVKSEISVRTRNQFYTFANQTFKVPLFRMLEKPQLKNQQDGTDYIFQKDFDMMRFTGSGQVSGKPQLIKNLGCDMSDFDAFDTNNIAFIRRGTCLFANKVTNAQKAGAKALILINTDDNLILASSPGQIPVFLVGKKLGDALVNQQPTLTLFAKNFNGEEQTHNLCAESIAGSQDDVIVVGSHSDSVEAGPGINDNGSGTSVILEIALQIFLKGVRPVNKLRFCWWGAEEIGLLGSYAYVNSLTPEQLSKIALNLNFDMLGSPNFFRGVYHGGATTVDPRIRTSSGNIQKIFEDHFKAQNLAFDFTPFDGRSDYGPFIEKMVPAGGLATGAEGIKSEDQARRFGGQAGVAFDVCYHQACDTIANVNTTALHQMGQSAANAVYRLATQQKLREFLSTPLPEESTQIPVSRIGSEKRKVEQQ